MKQFIYFLFLFILFLVPGSCKKKEPNCACGVEQPEENLPWLKDILSHCFYQDIYKCSFKGIEYIIIADTELSSDRMEIVYDCNGLIICQHGGMFPGAGGCDLPSSFWDVYENNKILIYELRINPNY